MTLGLSIPPLLSLHFVGTRMQHEWFGVDDSYSLLVLTLWHAQPWMTEASDSHHRRLAARLHRLSFLAAGCGQWYRRVAPILFLGQRLYCCRSGAARFTQAGHEVDSLVARNPDWIAPVAVQQSNVPPRSQRRIFFIAPTTPLWRPMCSRLFLTLLARIARDIFGSGAAESVSDYPGEREVQVPRGFSVLEASRLAGHPARVRFPGGRGRCSTCAGLPSATDGLPRQPLAGAHLAA